MVASEVVALEVAALGVAFEAASQFEAASEFEAVRFEAASQVEAG